GWARPTRALPPLAGSRSPRAPGPWARSHLNCLTWPLRRESVSVCLGEPLKPRLAFPGLRRVRRLWGDDAHHAVAGHVEVSARVVRVQVAGLAEGVDERAVHALALVQGHQGFEVVGLHGLVAGVAGLD